MLNKGGVHTSVLIIREASRLFHQKGYHATSMNEIAVAVGIDKATVYHHFVNKQAILEHIVDGAVGELLPKMESIVNSPAPLVDRLRQLIRQHISYVTNNPANQAILLSILQFEQPGLPAEVQAGFRQDQRKYGDLVKSLVSEGIESGIIRAKNPAVVASTILGACNWMTYWYKPNGPLSADEVTDLVIDQILYGIV